MKAKAIELKPISKRSADQIIIEYHYSGKVVRNSQLHFGVFLEGRLEGALSFGPSMDKRKLIGLVAKTRWNGFIELNRMALSDRLPRNSESRALGVALRTIRKQYPFIEWVVSFADGAQCGTGTIYRAAGFILTGISGGDRIWKVPADLIAMNGGPIAHELKIHDKSSILSKHILNAMKGKNPRIQECIERFGGEMIPGFQYRYIYFLNPKARERLTVQEIPFTKINEKSNAREMAERPIPQAPGRFESDPRAPIKTSPLNIA